MASIRLYTAIGVYAEEDCSRAINMQPIIVDGCGRRPEPARPTCRTCIILPSPHIFYINPSPAAVAPSVSLATVPSSLFPSSLLRPSQCASPSPLLPPSRPRRLPPPSSAARTPTPVRRVSNISLHPRTDFAPADCAIPCLTNADFGSCAQTDITCLCNSSAFITSTTVCIQGACTGTDLANAEAAARSECEAVVRVPSSFMCFFR
ncbi:hypothetical protein BV25DRAFT_1825595 [Artomyces pyxidatus]|uniref:Uncharacterized protein n=1 Tax=Artomyces pyxidatus TaxID=48021 RepID=A0ACB8T241_9AGAM|nr:hypothetical protein BV25DRAFT_1825595 [Artomyces pyxidatus]